jgi:hypothetical protein
VGQRGQKSKRLLSLSQESHCLIGTVSALSRIRKRTAKPTARRSAIGGASNEAGAAYRAAVGAVLAAHALRGWGVRGLELPNDASVPLDIRVETDDPVDDIGCSLQRKGYAYIQAKRSLQLSTQPGKPLAKAMAQCCAAAETLALNPSRHRLVLATANPSDSIRVLGKALRRRRNPLSGNPNAAEREALERLSPPLEGLPDEKRNLLLDCLVVWVCDAEDRTAHEAERASLLLDNSIVSAGLGESAFKALKEAAHDLGRLREGVDIKGMVQILRENQLELLGDVSEAAALQLVARQQAETAYRQRLQRDGETIRLLGVGAGVPNLELADVDAEVKAAEPSQDEERESERDLGLLVRRRGKLLLTGLPGSGKSTAMRQAAAEQAAISDAPLSLFVDLKKFAGRIETESALDALVGIVCGEAPPKEQGMLREQVLAAIDAGNATLYLDALDETRGKKQAVVSAIDDLLRHLDNPLEVVLATRDVGVVAGRTLGFKEARLIPPSDLDQVVSGVLKAVAIHRSLVNPKLWVRSREKWVKQVLARDPDLRSTPLMPILLAVTAASHSDAVELPSLRAEILKRVVRDVVQQWEASRATAGTLRLGALDGTRAGEALFGCFIAEGAVLAGESLPTMETTLDKVSEYLQGDWSLAPGDAKATAQEAIDFWDEAGFFLKTPEGQLEARVRLFSELADALHWIEADPEKLRRWVAENVSDPDRAEALKLAAGLSPQAGEALITEAASAGELAQMKLATDAITESAKASPEAIDGLVAALVEAVRQGGDDAVDAAALLTALPATSTRRAEASEAFAENLTPDQALIAQVRADIHWKLPHTDAVLKRFKEVLTIKSPQRIGSIKGGRQGFLELWGVDSRWGDAVAGAAEALVPCSEEAAHLAAKLINETGRSHSDRISAVLRTAGYDELVSERLAETTKAMRSTFKFREIMQRSDEAEVAIFETIATLGQPREMTIRERRGLDELADLLYTLGIPGSIAGEADALALDVPEAMRLLFGAIVELGGFDIPLLAAQATLALRELDDDRIHRMTGLLFIPGSARKTTHWDVPKRPEQTRDDLIRMFKTFPFAALTAAIALGSAPPKLEVPNRVLAQRSNFRSRNRRLASLLVLSMLSARKAEQIAKQLADDDDSFGRMGVASFTAQSFGAGATDGERSLLIKTLQDRDATVRSEAIRSLKTDQLDEDLREQVSDALEGATCWTCMHCGVENTADLSACRNCNTNEPDLARRIDELLSPAVTSDPT